MVATLPTRTYPKVSRVVSGQVTAGVWDSNATDGGDGTESESDELEHIDLSSGSSMWERMKTERVGGGRFRQYLPL